MAVPVIIIAVVAPAFAIVFAALIDSESGICQGFLVFGKNLAVVGFIRLVPHLPAIVGGVLVKVFLIAVVIYHFSSGVNKLVTGQTVSERCLV